MWLPYMLRSKFIHVSGSDPRTSRDFLRESRRLILIRNMFAWRYPGAYFTDIISTTLDRVCISNCIHPKLWENNYLYISNFNGGLVKQPFNWEHVWLRTNFRIRTQSRYFFANNLFQIHMMIYQGKYITTHSDHSNENRETHPSPIALFHHVREYCKSPVLII